MSSDNSLPSISNASTANNADSQADSEVWRAQRRLERELELSRLRQSLRHRNQQVSQLAAAWQQNATETAPASSTLDIVKILRQRLQGGGDTTHCSSQTPSHSAAPENSATIEISNGEQCIRQSPECVGEATTPASSEVRAMSQEDVNSLLINTLEQEQQVGLDSVHRQTPNELGNEIDRLLNSRPVFSILNSLQFRENLEEIMRDSLLRDNDAAPVPASRSTHNEILSQSPGARPANTSNDGQHATTNNEEAPVRDIIPQRFERLIDPEQDQNVPTIEQRNSAALISNLSELIHHRLVSTTLQSAFRARLENMFRNRLSLPERQFVVNDQQTMRQTEILESTSMPFTDNNPTVQQQLNDMRKMMARLYLNQLDTNRFIQQELAAALGASTNSSTNLSTNAQSMRTVATVTGKNNKRNAIQNAGTCLICLEKPVDTMVYRCGHLCMCHDCSLQMRCQSTRQSGEFRSLASGLSISAGLFNEAAEHQESVHDFKCPVCRAPIVDLVRVFTS